MHIYKILEVECTTNDSYSIELEKKVNEPLPVAFFDLSPPPSLRKFVIMTKAIHTLGQHQVKKYNSIFKGMELIWFRKPRTLSDCPTSPLP